MSAENEYFKQLAAMEQAGAGLRPIASILGSYMNALLENNFQRCEAIRLVEQLQTRIMDLGFSSWNPDQKG